MEYFTKQWYISHQPPNGTKENLAAAKRVCEAYDADPRVQAVPLALRDWLDFRTDETLLAVIRETDALALSLGDEEGEWHRLIFVSPYDIQVEDIEGGMLIRSELFKLPDGYQVNILAWKLTGSA